MSVHAPASRPCYSCPYRRDVPSGVWAAEEYAKLARYDAPTGEQPLRAFLCHQQDGRLCAGWVACHDMQESLSVRLLISQDRITEATYERILDYASPIAVWETGAQAAAHGLKELDAPGVAARDVMLRLIRKQGRQ